MIKNVAVRKALLEKGLQIQEVAKQLGYTRGHVSGVLNDRFDSPKVKTGIALLLGKDFDSLWPVNTEDQKQNAI
ncbi:MAG: helix-turn-helix transcriptional regulator [Desulfosalsimonadaceae bacterium]